MAVAESGDPLLSAPADAEPVPRLLIALVVVVEIGAVFLPIESTQNAGHWVLDVSHWVLHQRVHSTSCFDV